MLRLALLSVVCLAVAGCHVGPGIACVDDTPCGQWGRCATGGFCLAFDAGLPVIDAGRIEVPDGGGVVLASLSTAPLDFGQTGCGDEERLTLRVNNVGTLPLVVSASTSNPAFSLSQLGATVQPGEAVDLELTVRIPASSAPGQQQDGVLTLTTNDPAQQRLFVPLHATAVGVALVATPALLSFGVVPVNVDAPPIEVTLTNTGNITATVRVSPPADAQFTFSGPSALTIEAGASVTGLRAHFRPTRSSPSNTSAALQVTQRVCGVSLSTLPLSGQGTTGVVGVSTTDVFFGTNGRVECGSRSPPRTVVLSNGGNASYAWAATLARGAGSPFTATPSSGVVPAMGSVVVSLSTSAIPAAADTTQGAFSDVLTIATDAANDSPHAIDLHQSAAGAVLRFAPLTLDFGNVPVTSSVVAPVSLINSGSAPVRLSVDVTPPSFSTGVAVVLAPVGATGLTTTFAPTSAVPVTGTLSVQVVPDGGVLCAPLPPPLALTGTGTSGSVAYSPLALDFGAVDCGSTAAPRVITFSNLGNLGYQVTASLGRAGGSPFSLSMQPANGQVAPGGALSLTVTPDAVPATSAVTDDLYADVLTINTNVSGDSPHLVPLHMSARGAIISSSSGSLAFGDVPVGASVSSQLTVTNTGNAPGTLRLAPGQPTLFSLPQSVALNAGAASVVTGVFSPMAIGSVSDAAALSVTAGTVLCQPLPGALTLTGTGTGAPVVFQSETSLTFGTGGFVPCGTQGAARTFTLRNDASQALSLSYALSGGPSAYLVSGPATVAAGATVTVTVTPRPLPSPADTSPDFYAETLTVTAAGGPVNEPHLVALHLTAQGAKLTFSPTTLTFTAIAPAVQTLDFFVENGGNAPATYALVRAGSARFTETSTATVVPANNRAGGAITFTPVALEGPQSGTLALTSSSTLCAPLPANLTFTGP